MTKYFIFFCVLICISFNKLDACNYAHAFTTGAVIAINHNSASDILDCRQWYFGNLFSTRNIVLIFQSTTINCGLGSNIIVKDDSNREVMNYCVNLMRGFSFQYASAQSRYLIVETSMRSRGANINATINFSLSEINSISASTSTSTTTRSTSNQPNTNLACGRPAISPSDLEMKIIGGSEAVPNSWPWQVLITDQVQMCGGTILNNRWILTAAHCFTGALVSNLRVYYGLHDISSVSLRNSNFIRVSSLIRHESFSTRTYANDIALIRLDSPLTFSRTVSPACLPTRNLLSVGRVGMVTGWGLTSDFGRTSNTLRQVAIPIQQLSVCPFRLDGNIQICAGNPTGIVKDACQGDSGGPLVIRDGDSFVVVGVVSFGGELCDGRGVYANVYGFLDWIRKYMS